MLSGLLSWVPKFRSKLCMTLTCTQLNKNVCAVWNLWNDINGHMEIQSPSLKPLPADCSTCPDMAGMLETLNLKFISRRDWLTLWKWKFVIYPINSRLFITPSLPIMENHSVSKMTFRYMGNKVLMWLYKFPCVRFRREAGRVTGPIHMLCLHDSSLCDITPGNHTAGLSQPLNTLFPSPRNDLRN